MSELSVGSDPERRPKEMEDSERKTTELLIPVIGVKVKEMAGEGTRPSEYQALSKETRGRVNSLRWWSHLALNRPGYNHNRTQRKVRSDAFCRSEEI